MGALFKIAGFSPYLAVVFLNAFVDLGHKITIQNTVFKTYEGDVLIILTAIVNALILLPFILLFTPSGFLADKYPKNNVMRISAWAAVCLTSLITVFYYLGWFWAAFAMTFLLAVQSAFYSPAKYGYIKEIAGKEKLARANGLVQATTTTAILAGTFVFSIFFEMYLADVAFADKQDVLRAIKPIGWFLILGAVVELVLAYRLPKTQDLDEKMLFDWEQYRSGHYLVNNLKAVKSHEVIFLSIIGLSIFWAIGQVMLAAFPAFAKENLHVSDTRIIQGMLACAGVGIMLGSIIAGKASKNHIETALIPTGSLGIAICLFILPGLGSVTAHSVNILLLGVLGGMFIIPLNALIQFHADKNNLGRVLAGNNLIQNAVMLGFLVLTVLFSFMDLSHRLFTLLTAVALAGTIYTAWKLPQSLVRFLTARIIGQHCRLEVLGFANIPETGGVLLLGNHMSRIDWAIVQMASPRPIRFIMEKETDQKWYLNWFLDRFGVIPLSDGMGPSTLKTISEMLKAGEAVCLFPGGASSGSGALRTFEHDYEKVAKTAADGVILPFHMRGLRGSGACDGLTTTPVAGGHIIIAFGEPLPINTGAGALKRHIFDLSIATWTRYTETFAPLPYAFMDRVRRAPDKTAVVDGAGERVSYRELATGCLCLSRRIKQQVKGQHIGVLLPAGSAGIIANMAALMAGKTLVNLNYTADINALQAALAKAQIKHVYTSRQFLAGLAMCGMDLSPLLSELEVVDLDELEGAMLSAANICASALLSIGPAWVLKKWRRRHVEPDAPAAIFFASDSEGAPEGVMLSHRDVMANVKQIATVLNTQSSDVIMATLPLFQAFGFTITTLIPAIEGIPIVSHPDPNDVVNVAKAVAKYKATILPGTATSLRAYTKSSQVHPPMLASLRIVVTGAEQCSPDVQAAFELKFNKAVFAGYGASETTPVASFNIPGSLALANRKVRPGAVGMPLPGVRFLIVDPETWERLPAGEDGLILIGGAQVSPGYWQDDKKTSKVIVEIDKARWYKTGDKGHLDEDGSLIIVGRYSHPA